MRDALVDGCQSLISALELPVPDDCHDLAAAIKCGAHLIITFNLDDFPVHVLASYGLGACRPDLFLVDQLNLVTLEEQSLSKLSEAVRHCAAEL